MPKSGLIITADDYGQCPEINAGIREAVEKGIVNSVHVMANLVDQDAINQLITSIQLGGNKCGIGLHINTTSGLAMIQESASFKHQYNPNYEGFLYNDLNTYNHGAVIRNPAESLKMKREMEEQFNYLAHLIGGAEKLDAISSHYNFHFWDTTFLGFIIELAKPNNIPVRSPMRWKTKKQMPKTPQYRKGTQPLLDAAAKTAKRLSHKSTINLMATPTGLKQKKLIANYNTLINNNLSLPRNNSGHWFGQPSIPAMHWFIEQLDAMNEADQKSGYSSEIYMHLSNSFFGDDRNYGYSMRQRREEYNVVTDPDFIADFKATLAEYGTRHGSYRKILQGTDLNYEPQNNLV